MNTVVIVTYFVASVMLSLWSNDFIAKRVVLIVVNALYKFPLSLLLVSTGNDAQNEHSVNIVISLTHVDQLQ